MIVTNLESEFARDVNVEEVDLAELCNHFTLRVEHTASVVQLGSRPLRY